MNTLFTEQIKKLQAHNNTEKKLHAEREAIMQECRELLLKDIQRRLSEVPGQKFLFEVKGFYSEIVRYGTFNNQEQRVNFQHLYIGALKQEQVLITEFPDPQERYISIYKNLYALPVEWFELMDLMYIPLPLSLTGKEKSKLEKVYLQTGSLSGRNASWSFDEFLLEVLRKEDPELFQVFGTEKNSYTNRSGIETIALHIGDAEFDTRITTLIPDVISNIKELLMKHGSL